jgi:hypothetical protein
LISALKSSTKPKFAGRKVNVELPASRLGSISKQGDRYLRSLFVAGALSVIR